MRGCGCALGSTAIATRSTSEHGVGVPPEELLTSSIGRAMFALVGVLAEVERVWIVERTHAGRR
jgi:DNA invertase Pin-like site-specific DNA recombinase